MSVRLREVFVSDALRNVNLDVFSGEMGVIASADDTGTAILKVIANRLVPATGQVFIGGDLPGNVGPTAIRRLGVEVVADELPTAATTVLDALVFGTNIARTHAADSAHDHDITDLAAFHPGLALDARLDSLGAEEVTLVCVAAALAARPHVLLADGLFARAPRRFAHIVAELHRTCRETWLTVLLSERVSTDSDLACDISAFDRVFAASNRQVRQVRGDVIGTLT
jgi:ABC-type branched-subunit amino acid transport system ATPase component